MKRLTTFLAIIGLLGLGGVAYAQVMSSESNYLPSGKVVDDDLYVSGQSIEIDGTVNGDVYAAGSSVNIKGTVNGDVIAAGQDVVIGGTVKGSVRAAGSNVRLIGHAGGSASLAGQTVTVERSADIEGGAQVAGSTVNIQSRIGRGLVGGGSLFTIDSNIGKDASISAGTLNLSPTTRIGGNLVYSSDKFNKSDGATIAGETKEMKEPKHGQENAGKDTAFGALYGLIALLAAGSLLLWLAPHATAGVAEVVTKQPVGAFGWGVLVMLLSLPVLVVLLISFIGIPLALISGVVLAAALYLAKYLVALSVGNVLRNRAGWKANAYADALIGLIVLTLVELIPVLGGLVKLTVALIGIGGILLYVRLRRGHSVAPKPSKA
ncbi:MAG TPA: polymer-forming cytoskeletal protein [Candidatus Saccharimonadales bacterium]|nr:polymer-forming cytoskeletal protein [Candidatus Saccharimonadales bacterium]